MTSLFTPLSYDEIDDLADFLDGLPSPEAMNIERLDGFLCALFVGPDPVMPSEYWPYIVGSDMDEDSEPAFETVEHANAIMQLVARHWNTIAQALNNDELYLPLVLDDENGNARGNDWAEGFMHGVAIRNTSWQPLLDDEEHAVAIVPMLALANESDPELKQQFAPLLSEDREQILEMMADGLGEIFDYFAPLRARSAAPVVNPVVRSQPKIGRNEPCPCGSGKKYRQCCLAKMH
jgi:uncharacterized protein